MKIKFKTIAAFFIFLLTETVCCLAADQQRSLSLGEAIYLSQTRSLESILSQENVRESLAQLSQAQGFFLPQIDGTLSQTRQTRNLQAQGIPLGASDPLAGPFNSFDARLRARQIVLDAAAITRLLAVVDGVKLSKAEELKARQDAMVLAGSFFLKAEIAAQKTGWAESWLKVSRAALRLVHVRFRQGQAKKSEVQKSKADFKRAFAQNLSEKNTAKDALRNLCVFLGWDPSVSLTLQNSETNDMQKILGGKNLDEILNNQPDIEAARIALRQKRKVRVAQWAEYFPKLSLLGEYGVSGEKPSDAKDVYLLGAEVTMPVFDGGERAAKAAESAAEERKSEENLSHTERQIKSDILLKQENLIISEKSLQAEETALLAAHQAMKEADQKSELGVISFWDKLYAGFELESAKIRHEEASANYIFSLMSLLRVEGKMEILSRKGTS